MCFDGLITYTLSQTEGNVAQNKTNACSIPMVDPQPLASTNVPELAPPEIRHLNRQTDGHKSRSRLYIVRGERLGRVDSGKTAIAVKNNTLPRWRSAAIIIIMQTSHRQKNKHRVPGLPME